jgi:hypothetical protein
MSALSAAQRAGLLACADALTAAAAALRGVVTESDVDEIPAHPAKAIVDESAFGDELYRCTTCGAEAESRVALAALPCTPATTPSPEHDDPED